MRPLLVGLIDDGTLFLTDLNEPFTPNRLTQLVRDYVKASEIGKQGACHLFRHTCATLMHENGAGIRFIQQLLGTRRFIDDPDLYQIKKGLSLCRPLRLNKVDPPPLDRGGAD